MASFGVTRSSRIWASVTLTPVLYAFLTKWARTRSPVEVPVVRRYFRMVSQLSRGRPAQFLLISQNRRCSMGFHFDVAGGVVGHPHAQAVPVAEVEMATEKGTPVAT